MEAGDAALGAAAADALLGAGQLGQGHHLQAETLRHPLEIQIQASAVKRSIGEVVQSRRRPLLGPSPG